MNLKHKIKQSVYSVNLGLFSTCLAMSVIFAGLSSCKDDTSYADMLKDEEKACNWYLAQQIVENDIPEDGNFITGEDAPFYRIDEDGYIYMQVVKLDKTEMAQKDDIVYFRFARRNILSLYNGVDAPVEGNASNLVSSFGSTNFIYKNLLLESSYQWGSGIQEPLKYVGYDSEVNLVMRAFYGFYNEQSLCQPYIMNVKYFKPEY